ncbi:MAG: DMT family transporter [Deltaproteobacteria bacterium]|nr:DMT family transporter [Deltaproteobacteria bacterium]
MKENSMRIIIAVVIGIAAISTASILIKLCDAHSLVIAAYRLGLASLLLCPVALSRRRYGRILRGRWKLLLLTGLFLGFHFILWIASLKYTSVASSVVIVSTNPIFVGLGSYLLLKERMAGLTILGILLAVAGAVIIGLSDFTFSRYAGLGDLLALGGAVMASGYLIAGRRLRQEMDLISYIFPVYSGGAAVVLLIGLAAGVSFFGYSSRTYALFLMLAIVPQLIGHSTFNWALKFFSASTVAVLILGEPIGSTLLAYLILGETLSPWKVIGGICILAGIYTAIRGDTMGAGMIISTERG